VHLYDVITRRTSWRYYHRDHLAIAEQAARWMAESLAWDEDRVQQELAEYRQAVGESSNCAMGDASRPPQHEQQQQVQPA
jgi:glycerol-3-phosphate dehydrogenase